MKNRLVFTVIIAFTTLLASKPSFAENTNVSVKIDGKEIQFREGPTIINDRTMVEFRTLFETLGYTISWNENDAVITVSKNGMKSMLLQIDSNRAIVGDKIVTLDTPPTIINNYAFVPLRFIAESSGFEVKWDENGIVNISKENRLDKGTGTDLQKNSVTALDHGKLPYTVDLGNNTSMTILGYKFSSSFTQIDVQLSNGNAESAPSSSLKINEGNLHSGNDMYKFISKESEGYGYITDELFNGFTTILHLYYEPVKNPVTNVMWSFSTNLEIPSVSFSGQTSNFDYSLTHDNHDISQSESLFTSDMIQKYLNDKYPYVDTPLGRYYFRHSVMKNNDNKLTAWDYWVQSDYQSSGFTEMFLSNDPKYLSTKVALKDFQRKIGEDLLSRTGSKKILGGYYHSFYKYPHLGVGLVSYSYCTWTNYDIPYIQAGDSKILHQSATYDETKPSGHISFYHELDSDY